MAASLPEKFSPELWDAAADEAMRRAGVELLDGHYVLAYNLQGQAEAYRRSARERQRELDEEGSRRR